MNSRKCVLLQESTTAHVDQLDAVDTETTPTQTAFHSSGLYLSVFKLSMIRF